MALVHINEQEILQRIGATELPKEAQQEILANILDALHTRIGMRLEDELTDEQLKEFSQLSEEKIEEWLKATLPNYDELVSQEVDDIVEEIKATVASMTKQ